MNPQQPQQAPVAQIGVLGPGGRRLAHNPNLH